MGSTNQIRDRVYHSWKSRADALYDRLPSCIQHGLSASAGIAGRFIHRLWDFMNPPLWAMLVSIIVASVPSLQRLFFDENTFVRNSVTRAIGQSGQVAVPLTSVVLGANLARSALPEEALGDVENPREERKLIVASLVARMLIPTMIMAPLLALMTRYSPINVLRDPVL